ncbi:hypothetical protein [Bacterioplanoides sp. SCSIO 12839]|nr:hypothetical protein [Bacterioplanoides sp. SCSIO 12839]UTW47489.1 hypothetical protein KFF03_13025 [Bacterioplanoides sp. SCSIO 12839]
MNILNTRTFLMGSLHKTAQAANGLTAGARVYFWWYGFGYFSQESGRQL